MLSEKINLVSQKIPAETCAICLGYFTANEMFVIEYCSHRYCFSCMERHVRVKLLQGILPRCPHEGCNFKLQPFSCKSFLKPNLFETMIQLMKEDSIPPSERIYCPYPTCSALMSKSQLPSANGRELSGSAESCKKCHRPFCVNCGVPWHDKMTCDAYKKLNPFPCQEDALLKTLAIKNSWRQCVKCNYIVSLVEGCNHVTCRCRHEFCYGCGAEWKNMNTTCTCHR